MKKLFHYILPALALVGAGCSDREEIISDAGETLKLQIRTIIPIDEEMSTRSLGDPGVAEVFRKPMYLNTFVCVNDGSKERVYNFQKTFTANESEAAWVLNADRTCYDYSDTYDISWQGGTFDVSSEAARDRLAIRAYIVASHDAFTFGQTIYTDGNKLTYLTEAQVLGLTFNAKNGGGKDGYINLRDIYSTPYNLSKSWTQIPDARNNREGYYGTLSRDLAHNNIFLVADTLYHTCAKVDFEWNTESIYQTNTVESIVLGGAQKTLPMSGYLFMPTENVRNTSYTNTYSKLLLGDLSADTQAVGQTRTMNAEVTYVAVSPDQIGNKAVKISFFGTLNGEGPTTYYLKYQSGASEFAHGFLAVTDPEQASNFVIAKKAGSDPAVYTIKMGDEYIGFQGYWGNKVIAKTSDTDNFTRWYIKKSMTENGKDYYYIVPFGYPDNYNKYDYSEINLTCTKDYVTSWTLNSWGKNNNALFNQQCNNTQAPDGRHWQFWVDNNGNSGTIAYADDENYYTRRNDGNKWSGRAYTYVIQPNADVVDYTFTTTEGKDNEGSLNPANNIRLKGIMSDVFPSWYKVNVNIKENK